MAFEYLPVDRDQQFLLPPSMAEWLPERHLVWFVLDLVARVDTGVLHARHPNDGVGRRAYDPDMLLGLLIYAYATGVRSSRQIERLCETDVAFRIATAGLAPDPTTIARFRQGHRDVAVKLFTDVLVVCREAGLAKVGVVAVDGTKIGADASLKRNRTRGQVEEERARITSEVEAMFDEAEAVDGDEDDRFGGSRGDELPAELASRARRGARLDAAVAALDAQQREVDNQRAAADDAARQAWEQREAEAAAQGRSPAGRAPASMAVEVASNALAVARDRAVARARDRGAREQAAAAEGRKLRGTKPGGPETCWRVARAEQRLERAHKTAATERAARAKADGDRRVNLTDPDSRLMKAPHGWIQGYNAQAAVNEAGLVLAAEVTQEGNDVNQCVPMMAATRTALDAAGVTDPVGTMVFDAGYLSDDNLTAEGPTRLIATGKSHTLKRSHPTEGPPPEGATPIEAMGHQLRTPEGAAIYAKRQHTVEPVFGDIKHLRGLRHFSHRGLDPVDAEWKLQTAAHNILKLFRHQNQPLTT